MDPHDAERLFQLGIAHKDRGETRRAVTLFRRALELDPRHGRARRELRTLPFPENSAGGRTAA
jgi:Flp pilus assembly protein TadD